MNEIRLTTDEYVHLGELQTDMMNTPIIKVGDVDLHHEAAVTFMAYFDELAEKYGFVSREVAITKKRYVIPVDVARDMEKD